MSEMIGLNEGGAIANQRSDEDLNESAMFLMVDICLLQWLLSSELEDRAQKSVASLRSRGRGISELSGKGRNMAACEREKGSRSGGMI